MSTKLSFGKMEFDLSPRPDAQPREPETPFRIAILGAFGGQAGIEAEPAGERRIRQIDSDNFERVFAQVAPRLRLKPGGGPEVELTFKSIEDFHPDRLLKEVGYLAKLVRQRTSPLISESSPAASASVEGTPGCETGRAETSSAGAAESEADLLARLMGGAPPKPAVTTRPAAAGLVERLARGAVSNSAVPDVSARQSALVSALDLELAERLRELLHAPEFQALEASWRAVEFLLREFGAEENIKIHILDVSKEELTKDLAAQSDLSSSAAWRVLSRQDPAQPWGLIAGLYEFRDEVADVETLGCMARMAARLRAPFVAAASPRLVGCDSMGVHPDPDDWAVPVNSEIKEAWAALRAMPEAAYLGLALPRFLARQPYGKSSDPIASFPFEELPADAAHELFLWANPAVLCASLLASAFQAEGWEMNAGGYGEIEGLPVYSYKEDGESAAKPCAEAWLSDRAGESIEAAGLMPVLSIKGRDAVRVARIRGLQNSAAALAGAWQ